MSGKGRWGVLCLLLAGAGIVRLLGWRDSEAPPARSGNVVIAAVPPPTSHPPSATPNGPPAPNIVAAEIARRYPFLKDVSLQCRGERCTLSASILPVQAQTDLDARQAMLLGGLAASLAQHGYILAVPFTMDEVDDNFFHLRAAVRRA